MNIAIIGGGGFSKALHEMILEKDEDKIAGYLNDSYIYIGFWNNQFFGPILSADKINKFYKNLKFVIGIENNAIRKHTVKMLNLSNESYASLIHKSAIVSPSAKIGYGTVIMANAVIGANSKVGNHCIINTGSIVDYECELSDFVYLSQNTTLKSRLKIPEGVQIHPGVAIRNNITIDEWSIV